MRFALALALVPVALLLMAAASFAQPATAPPETPGLTPVGRAYFPVPEGVAFLPIANAGFEDSAATADHWSQPDAGQIVEGPDAPEGRRYWRIPETIGNRRTLIASTARVEVTPNRYYLMSLWLRSDKPVTASISTESDRRLRGLGAGRRSLPSTGGQWRRVGVYFRMPAAAETCAVGLTIPLEEGTGAVDIDDVRLREAPLSEYAAAWDAWRKNWPARDIAPRPTDGQYLASSIRKLQGEGVPGKPFVIWAIGSSYTNFQGNGETQIRLIGERFPNAPEIRYKMHLGNATPWHFNRAWIEQFVAAENPDVIQIYSIGSLESMERLLQTIRRLTTADIVVPSIHWRMRCEPNWGVTDEARDQDVAGLRALCLKYGAEFVENRNEWAAFMRENNYELPQMLNDALHQNTEGKVIINENIARHYAAHANPAYDPGQRERRIATPWQARNAGERIAVEFTGNRIELVGRRVPGGGTVRVLIDGRPAEEVEAFYMTYIDSGENNAGRPWPRRDNSPHAVRLGRNVVPQTWTITMTSDRGGYRLDGSVTGFDGEGNALEPFTSNSGQIEIDPADWRGIRRHPNDPEQNTYGSKKDDTYFFEVRRGVETRVSFAAEGNAPETFVLPVARLLDNAPHRLELIAEGDGPVEALEFWAFEPPLK